MLLRFGKSFSKITRYSDCSIWLCLDRQGRPLCGKAKILKNINAKTFSKPIFFADTTPSCDETKILSNANLKNIITQTFINSISLLRPHHILRRSKRTITIYRYLSFVSLRTEKASAISLNFLSCSAFSSSLASLCLSGWWRTLDLALNSTQHELF